MNKKVLNPSIEKLEENTEILSKSSISFFSVFSDINENFENSEILKNIENIFGDK